MPVSYENELEINLLSPYFAWFWNNAVTQEYDSLNNEFQFTHTFFMNDVVTSDKFDLIKPMIYFFEKQTGLQIKKIIRIKANLMTKAEYTKDMLDNLVHTDYPNEDYKSFLYYVSDSDGDTIIFDENKNETNRFKPIKGDCLIFNSNVLHRPTPPSQNKRRVVLNFVFQI